MRVDVYLHHIRIYKTRSLSTKACDKGQVRVNGDSIKPSRILKVGDTLTAQREDLELVMRVIGFPKTRVGAPLVSEFMENLTPEENYARAAEARKMRSLGPRFATAKPDKKQLRELRKWMDQVSQSDTSNGPEDGATR